MLSISSFTSILFSSLLSLLLSFSPAVTDSVPPRKKKKEKKERWARERRERDKNFRENGLYREREKKKRDRREKV